MRFVLTVPQSRTKRGRSFKMRHYNYIKIRFPLVNAYELPSKYPPTVKMYLLKHKTTNLLLEIASVFLVHKHQVEEIFDTELFVNVSHGWSKIVASQEHADRDALPSHRRAIHDLILGNRLILCERVRTW